MVLWVGFQVPGGQCYLAVAFSSGSHGSGIRVCELLAVLVFRLWYGFTLVLSDKVI